ncbi:Na/Pi symporter [bacterium]|nr:Na/Pi symporter [bacterium]
MSSTEKFIKKSTDHNLLKADELADVENFKAKLAAQKAEGAADHADHALTDDEIRDKIKQEKWTEPDADIVTPEFRSKFIRTASFGALDTMDKGPVRDALYWLSGINWMKVALFWFVMYCIWVFLLVLSIMGTGFKLLGGKSSAQMFDVVDNPISGVMIGILATVLVQSSSTTTSIIIALVGAGELSVNSAVFMVMGANIGTSVTNTIVAMGHFANADDLRRGFSAATVHDCFNLLSVAVFLPLNWIYPFLEKMTGEMVKGIEACDKDAGDKCNQREFLKPYVSPYAKGIANYNKDVSKYVSQGYCMGMCDYSMNSDALAEVSKIVCEQNDDGSNDCSNVHGSYSSTWMSGGSIYKKRVPAYVTTDTDGFGNTTGAVISYSCPSSVDCDTVLSVYDKDTSAVTLLAGALNANTTYAICPKPKTGLCDKRLLKGGLALDEWDMTDTEAGTFLTIWSLGGLCACLFCIVYTLQIIIKGGAARVLKKVIGFNPYLNMVVGMAITIMVQSSSITTSTLTPIAAVGLITLEEMFPLTLGANIGTTLTGIMGATVATSNPKEAMQVALCHLFFNLFGIVLWYPLPATRNIPLRMCRFLGHMTAHPKYGKVFPLIYTFTVFFLIPGIAYGIAAAVTA